VGIGYIQWDVGIWGMVSNNTLYNVALLEKYADTKGKIRSLKSKMDRQYDCPNKKGK
jgi:hypothetical protein